MSDLMQFQPQQRRQKNPQRDLPVAILGTLGICTLLYVCVALVLTGVIPLNAIDTLAPLAHAMRYLGINWYAGLISVGALCALTTVLLIYQLGTTRILYAMSRDHFCQNLGMQFTKNLKPLICYDLDCRCNRNTLRIVHGFKYFS